MKVLCAVLVGLGLVSVVALADGPRADVSVTPAGNSVDVTIAVDILQAFRAPAVRSAPLLGKPFVATWETAKGTARYVNAAPSTLYRAASARYLAASSYFFSETRFFPATTFRE